MQKKNNKKQNCVTFTNNGPHNAPVNVRSPGGGGELDRPYPHPSKHFYVVRRLQQIISHLGHDDVKM